MAINTALILFSGNNDNLLIVDELTNNEDDTLITAGTVTATLKDEDGNNVAGETWPLSLNTTAVLGQYIATLESAISVVADESYTLVINADNGSGVVAEWELPVIAETRDS